MIEDIRIRGGPVRHIRFDTGGEFIPKGLAPACALLDVSISWCTTDRYVDRVENSHNRLSSVMRANHADADLDISKWPFNRSCAAHMLNMRAPSDKSRDIPMRRLTGRMDTLHSLLPYGSKIAALKHPPAKGTSANRAVISTYLAPASALGPFGIYHTVDGIDVRQTSTFRFLALPGHQVSEDDLFPADQTAPAPIESALHDPRVADSCDPHGQGTPTAATGTDV